MAIVVIAGVAALWVGLKRGTLSLDLPLICRTPDIERMYLSERNEPMSIIKSGEFIVAAATLGLLVGPVHGALVVKDGNALQPAAGYRVADNLNPQPEPPNRRQNQIKAVNPNNAGAPQMPQQPAPPPPPKKN